MLLHCLVIALFPTRSAVILFFAPLLIKFGKFSSVISSHFLFHFFPSRTPVQVHTVIELSCLNSHSSLMLFPFIYFFFCITFLIVSIALSSSSQFFPSIKVMELFPSSIFASETW